MAASRIYERDVPEVALALSALHSLRGVTVATEITEEEHGMILAGRRDRLTKFLENKGISVAPTPRDAPERAESAVESG